MDKTIVARLLVQDSRTAKTIARASPMDKTIVARHLVQDSRTAKTIARASPMDKTIVARLLVQDSRTAKTIARASPMGKTIVARLLVQASRTHQTIARVNRMVPTTAVPRLVQVRQMVNRMRPTIAVRRLVQDNRTHRTIDRVSRTTTIRVLALLRTTGTCHVLAVHQTTTHRERGQMTMLLGPVLLITGLFRKIAMRRPTTVVLRNRFRVRHRQIGRTSLRSNSLGNIQVRGPRTIAHRKARRQGRSSLSLRVRPKLRRRDPNNQRGRRTRGSNLRSSIAQRHVRRPRATPRLSKRALPSRRRSVKLAKLRHRNAKAVRRQRRRLSVSIVLRLRRNRSLDPRLHRSSARVVQLHHRVTRTPLTREIKIKSHRTRTERFFFGLQASRETAGHLLGPANVFIVRPRSFE
jgi:hypothetical protein